jgi:hypothetical protein
MPEDTSSPDALSFEKARYAYCKELHERERTRKEGLEGKAQTILSLVTLVLGVFFFKLDFLDRLKEMIAAGCLPRVVVWVMVASLSVFAPGSKYLGCEGEASFFKSTALTYAIALEHNSEINDQKAAWVRYSWYGMTAAAAALAVFLLLYAWAVLG